MVAGGQRGLQAVSMTRGAHKSSGGKLMYINNLNRVICAATTVLIDKVPILSTCWRHKGRLQNLKRKYCLVDERKNIQGREKHEQRPEEGKKGQAAYI